ncbi:MAG: paraquat-inducible protein A [Stenotrophobium sp.]
MNRLIPRAVDMQLIGCEVCGRVLPAATTQCPRCNAALRARKPASFTRSWALLITAAILYIPANLLPIMQTVNLLEVINSTIFSGVILLWQEGEWYLAIIVFCASVVIPLAKIGALALLLITAQKAPKWCPRERTQVYRIIEFIGHWSMLDVFVAALLLTLVHFGKFAQVNAGSAIIPFTGVVVLTMLASMSFDPRLIWDTPAQQRKSSATSHDRSADAPVA